MKKKMLEITESANWKSICWKFSKSRNKHGLQSNKFCTWKKKIDKGTENIPNRFRYGASKIKNKNVKRGLNSDIANYVVEETQSKAKNKLANLFGGV